MQERWNHPCVVIWDACNETRVAGDRQGDQQGPRPGFLEPPLGQRLEPAGRPGRLLRIASLSLPEPELQAGHACRRPAARPGGNRPRIPIIINEYGWLWLNRDGTPTTLTQKLYTNLLGPKSTTAQRRHLYARYLAAETEFWRCHRACAGVLHFCALGYSRPDGQTSDHWLDVEKLTWEPEFYNYVRDAFAPVGPDDRRLGRAVSGGPGRMLSPSSSSTISTRTGRATCGSACCATATRCRRNRKTAKLPLSVTRSWPSPWIFRSRVASTRLRPRLPTSSRGR